MQTTTQDQKSQAANLDKRTRGRYHADDVSRYAVTIGKPQEEVFRFFRNFENLPLFMKDLKEVQVISEKKSHWVVEVHGMQAEWDAEITLERQDEMLAWKSVKGSEVETSGSIWFSPAPGGKGTVVSLVLDYKIPGGKLAEIITKFTGEDPETLAQLNLRRLKAVLETGEVPTIEGQPSGREENSETIVKH